MNTLVLTLDPGKLANANLDLRYEIPDRLKELSNGNIQDNGYDYEDREGQSPLLVLFLGVNDVQSAITTVSQLVRTQRLSGGVGCHENIAP